MTPYIKPVLLTVVFAEHIIVTPAERTIIGRAIPFWAPETAISWDLPKILDPLKLVVLNTGYVRSSRSHLLVDDLVIQYVGLLALLGFTQGTDFHVEEEYKKGA